MNQIFADVKKEVFALLKYLKFPFENFNENLSFNQKWKIFTIIFLFETVFTLTIVIPLLYFVNEFVTLKYTKELSNFNIYMLILLGAFIVPFLEELVFRFPLQWRRNYIFKFFNIFTPKDYVLRIWSRFYRFFFFAFAIVFGLVHLGNFENKWTAKFILFSPIIVLSQLAAGFIFGYIRNRLGFFWSVAYHGIFNFCALLIPYLLYQGKTLIYIKDHDKEVRLVNMETNETGKSLIEKMIKNDTVHFYNIENMDPAILLNEITPGFYSDDISLLNFYLKSKKGIHKKELAEILKKELDLKPIQE